jgi:hypothetical protein
MRTTVEDCLSRDEIEALCALLAEEDHHYRRLRRLSWRQTAYLKRQDTARLEENSREWQKLLPEATAVRQRRETYIADLFRRHGLEAPRSLTQAILDRADPFSQTVLREAVQRLTRTVSDLYRQNGMNVLLARFCVDLIDHEAAIFKQCVLDDPAGCYAGDGQRPPARPGGVMLRQA